MKVGPATGSWSVVEVDEKFHVGVGDGLKVEGSGRRVCGSRGRFRLFFAAGTFFFRSSKPFRFPQLLSLVEQRTTRVSLLWFPVWIDVSCRCLSMRWSPVSLLTPLDDPLAIFHTVSVTFTALLPATHPLMMITHFFYYFWYLLCQKRVFGCVFDDLTGLLILSNGFSCLSFTMGDCRADFASRLVINMQIQHEKTN